MVRPDDPNTTSSPDVAVAPHIGEAARRAWTEDRTDYTPNGGIAPLRAAIRDKLRRENRIEVDVEQVWLSYILIHLDTVHLEYLGRV